MNEKLNNWQLTIGLEVHIQLSTKTKMFCGCPAKYGATPNSLICPICLALPGALPSVNKEAINMAIKLGHAFNFNINKATSFSRKNYYYPDLPKGYQITQFEDPICANGYIEVGEEENKKRINITRAHLEEDSGKLIHHSDNYSFVDLNRAGSPLIEIVSEPELHSAEDARLYLEKLKQTVKYIGISDCDMEKGNLRVDLNVSINKLTDSKLGIRREVKNLNSFKAVQKAINYELKAQAELLENGQKVEQYTLTWDDKNNKTKILRKKEDAHDYRYFPEPDLPPLKILQEDIDKIKDSLPELPDVKLSRFTKIFDVKSNDLQIITADKNLADYFEKLVKVTNSPQHSANWILMEVLRYLKEHNVSIAEFPISSNIIGELIKLHLNKTVTYINAQKILSILISGDKRSPENIMKEENLIIVNNDSFVTNIIETIFNENSPEFNRLKNGELQLIGFFMGKIMKQVKGKSDPQTIKKLIDNHLRK